MNRKHLFALASGAVLVVAAVAAAPLLVPTGGLRGEIESRVGRATGRAFNIHGTLAFTLFPDLGLTARDVTLANAPGGHAPDLVHMDAMHIAVRILPLFSGRIEASEIVLDKPVVALEVAPDGRANWKLSPAVGRGPRLAAGAAANTRFAGLTIEDGAVSYDNAKLDIHRAITGLDAKIALTRLDAAAGIEGSFVHRGRKLGFSANLATPALLLTGRATQVTTAVTSDFLNAGFVGRVAGDGTAAGVGRLRTPSLKDLASWLGRPVSAGGGLGPLEAQAQLVARGHHLALTGLKAHLDGMALAGNLDAELGDGVPRVDGTLSVDRLDLNTYMRAPSGPPGVPVPTPAQRPAGPPGGGWSKAPVRLDLIKTLSGHLALAVGRLDVLHLKIGRTAIAVTLQDGVMTAHLGPMQLYGGSGVAELVADVRGPVPLLANKLTFSGIAMAPFLADTIGVDKIAGTGTIALDVKSAGASPDAIMRSLSGRGTVAISGGSIRGVDMGRVARTVETILSAGATGQSAATDFDRFGGSFVIVNGMLSNNDLALSSAFINMTGAGRLDLGNQTIAYRIVPKASIGGRLHLLDVGVPFAITGSWNHVRYEPDIAGAVTGLIGGVLSKGSGTLTDLFKGLTGGGTRPDGKAPPNKKKKSNGLGDTLKGLFGIH
ncbi:MAG: AsmA family protein [Rhizomicrobium sp.]